jgi:cardiolipin synthase
MNDAPAPVAAPPAVGTAPAGADIARAEALDALLTLRDQAFGRAAGAPLVRGNAVRLLRDATENYPAWFEAIAGARERIHFESYIIARDPVGRNFVEALAAKAREGVAVRVLYDWLGTRRGTGSRFWRPLLEAGGEVRCFNPFTFESPVGWLNRDHRKSIAVDGAIGFISGLCVSRAWQGNPSRKLDPWRDTGVEIRGPAVGDIDRAFAQVWETTGPGLPVEACAPCGPVRVAGDVALRVIGTGPSTAGLFRLDQLLSAVARDTLWLADAYFVGFAPYVQALQAAARDGVDVRLLVPGASDLPWLKPITRAGYRPLLEAGVRLFEWNGPMLHAKSAVVDGRWSRVGSSNLNLASWVGNYELDVFVEDERFAAEMAGMYRDDLARSTEIVLGARRRLRPATESASPGRRPRDRRGIPGRAAAGALRVANTVGAAVGNRRLLDPAEARLMAIGGMTVAVLTAAMVFLPRVIVAPVAALGGWVALALLIKAWRLRCLGRRNERPHTGPRHTGQGRARRRRSDQRAQTL